MSCLLTAFLASSEGFAVRYSGNFHFSKNLKSSSGRLEAIAVGLEAIAVRLEAIAVRLEAIAVRLEAIAVSLEAIVVRLEAIAVRLEAIAVRLEAIAVSLEAIVVFFQASAVRLEAIASRSEAGWRPSLLGWRPLLLGWRPSLLSWRQVGGYRYIKLEARRERCVAHDDENVRLPRIEHICSTRSNISLSPLPSADRNATKSKDLAFSGWLLFLCLGSWDTEEMDSLIFKTKSVFWKFLRVQVKNIGIKCFGVVGPPPVCSSCLRGFL